MTKIVLSDKKGRVLSIPFSKAGASVSNCMKMSYNVRSYKLESGSRRIVSCIAADEFPEWRDDVRCFSGSVVLRTDRTGNQL